MGHCDYFRGFAHPSHFSVITVPGRAQKCDNEGMRGKAIFAVLFGVSVLIASCSSTPPNAEPSTTAPSPSSSSSVQTSAVALYWVGDTAKGLRLYREFKNAPVGEDPVATAVELLFTSTPVDPDYTNLWSAQSSLNGVTRDGDLVTVDIAPGPFNVGSEGEARAIDQLVWTVTAADTSIKNVRILVNGQKAESLAGHVDLTQAFSRGLSYEVLADIWILSPLEGQKITGDFVAEGVATTFEANVAWKVLQAGKVVKSGATTAGEAAPARAPWTVTVPGLAPGEYLFQAVEYSAKDGSLSTQDTKAFTIAK